jgi:hypothetical protein
MRRLPTVVSIRDSSSVHVSIASDDANPLSDKGYVYRGRPVGLLPMDGIDSLLGRGGSHFQDPSPPTTPLVSQTQVPAPDTMNQLMQVFATMLA